MPALTAFVAGLLFGLGLILSGMSNPAKVLNFLDLAGNWDPSLMFVMGGAILIGSIGFRFARLRGTAWLGPMHLPPSTHIDRRLVLGSLVFGIGWGLAGYCPGPALVSLMQGSSKTLVFVFAMVAGMAVHAILEHRSASRASK